VAFLASLWLPILVSAVLVFVVSAASHMLVPYRQREWRAAPEQEALQRIFRGKGPGLYVFPSPESARERGRPEHLKRWAEGPSAFLALVPAGPVNMGRNLGLSFLLNLVVSFVTAYVAAHALGAAPHYLAVFRVVGTIGFLAYATGALYEGIWYWRPWQSLAMGALDALLYGLAMAGTFGWLWPR
jgi:hypothetical protein